MTISGVIIVLLSIWVIILTIVVAKFWTFFALFSKDTNTETITKLLEHTIRKEEKNSQAIDDFAKKIELFGKKEADHMQKYGFVRFNPFGDMGGDHSFCIALVNGKNTGFILTGLHTRERTRVYVKHIKRGKSEYDLSKEEKKALDDALKEQI